MLAKIFSRLKDLIKRSRITKAGADDGDFNIQQVSYLGKTADCEVIFPYGMSANLPENAVLVMFNVNANEQNRAGIGGLASERKKNLESGEVAFFHPLTKSFIYFKNNGDIDIDTEQANDGAANINVTCKTLNVTSSENINLTATEAINLMCDTAILTASTSVDVDSPVVTITASTSIDFDTPIATFTGNVDIDGNLTVTGSSTLSATVTSGGTDISNTHTHPINSGSSAPGPTGTP